MLEDEPRVKLEYFIIPIFLFANHPTANQPYMKLKKKKITPPNYD